jgi:hypothetical protein
MQKKFKVYIGTISLLGILIGNTVIACNNYYLDKIPLPEFFFQQCRQTISTDIIRKRYKCRTTVSNYSQFELVNSTTVKNTGKINIEEIW